jgi:hypothetical protein
LRTTTPPFASPARAHCSATPRCSSDTKKTTHDTPPSPSDPRIKVDAETREIVRTLTSDRFVTGVSVVEGVLWHGASDDGKPCELRRLAADGTMEEALAVPVSHIAGVEGDGGGGFWCGGEKGTLRLVRRKKTRA